jgi:hypothetical protein
LLVEEAALREITDWYKVYMLRFIGFKKYVIDIQINEWGRF